MQTLQVSKRTTYGHCYRVDAIYFFEKKVLGYSTVCFELPFIDKHGSSYRR